MGYRGLVYANFRTNGIKGVTLGLKGRALSKLPFLFSQMSLLSPLIQVFRYSLQPIAPFTWFGLSITTLDVVAAFRLCFALRQLRDSMRIKHLKSKSPGAIEERSFIKNLSTTLIVVYGGEAVACMIMFSNP